MNALIGTAGGAVDFHKEGKNLLEGDVAWKPDRGQSDKTSGGWKLRGPVKGTSTFTTTIPVEAGSEYFFSVETLSDDRAVFFLGGLSMSYFDQGNWQKVCGLVRSNQNTLLELKVQLKSLEEGREPVAEIRGLALQKVSRPTRVESLPRNGTTPLVAASRAEAVIVYPENGKQYGEQVRDAILEKTGTELSLLSDGEATEKDFPILRQDLREKHLIIIGRLVTNRALWPAYNHFLTAEDGYYPGGDGFVVRTAADVFGNGKNHVILGGSSDAGVAGAVRHFTEWVASNEDGKTLVLPWTLKVELGGECLAAFERDNALWANPEDPALPAQTSGYGKVVRWYQNAMGYYWSGWPQYLDRSKAYLKTLLEERAHTHQYIVEFFVRTYEMLDDSPVFSPQEINQLDSLVLENFLDFLTVTDLTWMTIFSPPYENILMTNRHQIAPWYADLLMARFLKRHVDLAGDLRDLVDFRLGEKDAVFRSIVATRNGPSLPGMAASSDYEEFPAMFFRYALENDQYREFFASGLAHQTLALERFNHASGRFAFPACSVDLSIWLGAMAHLTGDGRYQWLTENVKFSGLERGPFQGRYVAGVHRYQPGNAIPASRPDASWSGIHVAPQPDIGDQGGEADRTRFPLISMRGGFGPEDDYLAVAGYNRALPSGSLVCLDTGGLSAFAGADSANGGGTSRSTTNGASVVRLSGFTMGQGPTDEGTSPCVLDWKAELPGVWAFQTTTEVSPDVNWTRDIIRLADGRYVFRDTFAAKRAGKYLLQVGWLSRYGLQQVGEGWEALTNRGTVRIEKAGPEFSERRNGNSLTWESVRSMQPGETATVWTVVQKLTGENSAWTPQAIGDLQLQLNNKETSVVLRAMEISTSEGKLDADLTVALPDGIGVFGWGPKKEAVFLADSPAGQLATTASDKTKWIGPIRKALEAQSSLAPKSGQGERLASEIPDETAQWKKEWSYQGLLRPSIARADVRDGGIFDLGKVCTLAEIRSVGAPRIWAPSFLPKALFAAPENAVHAPAPDSPDWKPIEGKRVSRPGTKTGNYGESTPVDHADESLFVEGVRTRFVRSSEDAVLKFFVADDLVARHPVRIDVLRDLPGAASPLIEARSDIFAAFPRPIRDDDFSLALLDSGNGKAVAEVNVNGPVQSVLIADQKGKGEAEIFVLRADVRMDVFSLKGEAREPIDLYGQFMDFQKRHGRENTRGPAGGHFMPFAMGLWRPNANGAYKFVISRYGSHAFLDENRRLEGLLRFPSYASPGMLSRGQDFDGDGREEILTLERFNLVHIGGDAKPTIGDPDGAIFWPEVYENLFVGGPKGVSTTLLAGAPIYCFETLQKFSGNPRFVFVARGNYVGLYDAVERKWNLYWRPPAPVSAAAIVRETKDRFELCLATVDGLFWDITWDARRPGRPAISVNPIPLLVRQIQAGPDHDGLAVIAAAEGLYLRHPDARISKAADGAFHSAALVSAKQIAASTERGDVLGFSLVTPD